MTNIIGIECGEGNSVGAKLYTLNATTNDVGKAAVLSYSLSSLDTVTTTLWVNSATGVISAMNVFRYDVKQRYLFLVTVSDGNEIPLSATATLVLDITKVDTKTNNSVPSAGLNSSGGESNSVVITAVVCATVIVVVVVIVIVISVLCYRRKNNAAAERQKNAGKVLPPVGRF